MNDFFPDEYDLEQLQRATDSPEYAFQLLFNEDERLVPKDTLWSLLTKSLRQEYLVRTGQKKASVKKNKNKLRPDQVLRIDAKYHWGGVTLKSLQEAGLSIAEDSPRLCGSHGCVYFTMYEGQSVAVKLTVKESEVDRQTRGAQLGIALEPLRVLPMQVANRVEEASGTAYYINRKAKEYALVMRKITPLGTIRADNPAAVVQAYELIAQLACRANSAQFMHGDLMHANLAIDKEANTAYMLDLAPGFVFSKWRDAAPPLVVAIDMFVQFGWYLKYEQNYESAKDSINRGLMMWFIDWALGDEVALEDRRLLGERLRARMLWIGNLSTTFGAEDEHRLVFLAQEIVSRFNTFARALGVDAVLAIYNLETDKIVEYR